MYYPCSKNKGADQLRGYREADLRLCFCLCRLLVFPRGGSYVYQLGIILKYGDNLHIGGLSLFSETSNVKNSCIPKNQVSLDQGNVSRFGDKHLRFGGHSPHQVGSSPSGGSMKKCHIFGIFRLSCAFYYEKVHVKTSWDDTSPSRPKFNPLHQENSPLQ